MGFNEGLLFLRFLRGYLHLHLHFLPRLFQVLLGEVCGNGVGLKRGGGFPIFETGFSCSWRWYG
jgi:hypothetical protein